MALKSLYVLHFKAEIGLLRHSFCDQSDKISSILEAAGVDAEPIWATLLAKALEGKNVKDLLSNVGAGGGAPVAGGAAPAAAAGGAAEAPAEEKEEEKEEEESDDDMVRLLLRLDPQFSSDMTSWYPRASACSTDCSVFFSFLSFVIYLLHSHTSGIAHMHPALYPSSPL